MEQNTAHNIKKTQYFLQVLKYYQGIMAWIARIYHLECHRNLLNFNYHLNSYLKVAIKTLRYQTIFKKYTELDSKILLCKVTFS